MSFVKFCDFCEEYEKPYEIVREKAKFHKIINTDNKSVEQVYQSFKEKAYGII